MRRIPHILLWLLLPLPLYAFDLTVQVAGVDKALEENVRAFLSIEQEKSRESLTASRLRMLHKRAPDEIRRAIQPFGYFKPEIKSKLTESEKGFTAVYEIDPGPPVLIERVDFQLLGEGTSDPRLQVGLPLAEGDVLDHSKYEKGKQLLQANAVENGYLNALYTRHEARVDMDAYTATVHLHLDTGKLFHFGDVRFNQDILDPEFLARYLKFQPGDPFSHEKLLKLQSQLIDSEYFSNVEVRTLRNQAVDERVPIEIYLTPNKRDRYRAGLGYATDTGPRVTLDWKRRRLNREGHRLSSELRLSQVQSGLQSEYTIPLDNPASDSISLGASINREESDSRTESIALIEANHSVGLGEGWRRTLELAYSYEEYDVADESDDALLLVPAVEWTHIESDKLEFIQRGRSQNLRIEGAAEQLFSDTSYLQFSGMGRYIYGFGGGDWRLLTRAELGATLSDSVTDLPGSKRFFAGGDNSIRGFDLDELGPRDDAGDLVGGRYLAVASLELERRLFGKWSAAAFVDVGNAFDPDYGSDLEYGAGIGVRWRSPIGPIRVDLASGLSADDPDLRLHIVVGPEL